MCGAILSIASQKQAQGIAERPTRGFRLFAYVMEGGVDLLFGAGPQGSGSPPTDAVSYCPRSAGPRGRTRSPKARQTILWRRGTGCGGRGAGGHQWLTGRRKYMVCDRCRAAPAPIPSCSPAGEPIHLGQRRCRRPRISPTGSSIRFRSPRQQQTMDLSLQDLLAQTKLFVHGSTVVDNIVSHPAPRLQGRVDHHPGDFEDTLLMTAGPRLWVRWGGFDRRIASSIR